MLSVRNYPPLALNLAIPFRVTYSPSMSARDAMIDEIKRAPESLVREAYDFLLFLKSRRTPGREIETAQHPLAKPDFLARQKALFGSRVVADSQAILDELRAERF